MNKMEYKVKKYAIIQMLIQCQTIREFFYRLLPFKGRSAGSQSSRRSNWINQTVPLSL